MGGASTDVMNLEDEFQDIQKSLGNVPTTNASPLLETKQSSTKPAAETGMNSSYFIGRIYDCSYS
jgi:hypothetical protein